MLILLGQILFAVLGFALWTILIILSICYECALRSDRRNYKPYNDTRYPS